MTKTRKLTEKQKSDISVIISVIILGIALIFYYVDFNSVSASSVTTNEQIVEESCTEITLEEKYSSVFEWQVYTGDFGAEQLYYLKEQCDKYNVPMEIMLSVICTESSFRSDAKSSISSASGYCQIVESTAEWVYEDLLKYGDYSTNYHTLIMTNDWELNLEMGTRLMCRLYNNSNSWEEAVKKYHGGCEEVRNTYLNNVNTSMIELFNMTVSDIN